MVNFEDFKKLDLRIGKIEKAERVQGSEKLIKLSVSLGEESRQIIAGIGKSYELADLLGKQIVIVSNLKPRTFNIEHNSERVALESQGMLLAIRDGEDVVLLTPEREVPPGSVVS